MGFGRSTSLLCRRRFCSSESPYRTRPNRLPWIVSALTRNLVLLLTGRHLEEEILELELERDKLRQFAKDYTAAWCSQDPGRVASFFAPDGSLTINGESPCVGRSEIMIAASGFMLAFPDLVVAMDDLTVNGTTARYHWTLTGTNTGPGGTGRRVEISGYEEWTLNSDGLIARSLGHFDEKDFERQVTGPTRAG